MTGAEKVDYVEHRAWTGTVIRQAQPGIFTIGDGWLEELGVRWRIVHYDKDADIWYGERP